MNARILPNFDILRFGGRLQSLNELLQVWAFNLCLSAVWWDFDVLLAVRALGIHFCNFFANYYFIKYGRLRKITSSPTLTNFAIYEIHRYFSF